MDSKMLDVVDRVFDKLDAMSDAEFFENLNKERDGGVTRAFVELSDAQSIL